MLYEVFSLVGFLLAISHIVLVVLYANHRQWGSISWFGSQGLFRTPGGALAFSFPVVELSVILMMTVAPGSESVELIRQAALHLLRVRLLLCLLFGLPVFLNWWKTGQLRVFCMDKRLNHTVTKSGNMLSLHSGICGAFVLLTLAGLFPSLLVFSVLLWLGVSIPLWLVWIGFVPWLFLFAKRMKIVPASWPDTLEKIVETPGMWLSSWLLKIPTAIHPVKD